MNYTRPNLWKIPYASFPSTPLGGGDGAPVSEAAALRLATQLETPLIGVTGTMNCVLSGDNVTLDLGTSINPRIGGGIYGKNNGFSCYWSSFFYRDNEAGQLGATASEVEWKPRADPASRVLCDAFTSNRLVDFNFVNNDDNQRASMMVVGLYRNAGQWYLEYQFLFSQNPPPAYSAPPFYLCNPASPGVYPLRASGTWDFYGVTLNWEARSPLSAGPDVWGPAVGCGLTVTPVFE